MKCAEPALALGDAAAGRAPCEAAYATMAAAGAPIHLVVPYDDLAGAAFLWVKELPVAAIGLDFCGVPGAAHGCGTAQLIAKHGWPEARRGLRFIFIIFIHYLFYLFIPA